VVDVKSGAFVGETTVNEPAHGPLSRVPMTTSTVCVVPSPSTASIVQLAVMSETMLVLPSTEVSMRAPLHVDVTLVNPHGAFIVTAAGATQPPYAG